MSLRQSVYCQRCGEVNLIPARAGRNFNCVRCGQTLNNPFDSLARRAAPERDSIKFASVFLSAVVVVVTCSYALVVSQQVIPTVSEPDVRIWRRGKLDTHSRLRPASESITGRASVIDGDTISIRGIRIRLWGIDAPEGGQNCIKNGKTWRCGTDSARALDAFLNGRTVRCHKKDRDSHGRMVAVCWVGAEEIGGWLVRHGWALDYTRYSRGAYASEQRHAESQRLGTWQGEFEAPWEWRHK